MSSPLTLENRLILACARTEPDVQRIQELVARSPDWQEIVRKAERWRLVPLIYFHLRQARTSGEVPGPVLERLRHLSHRDTIHSVARRDLLRAALHRLAEANVPVIVLNEAALATLVYRSQALRPTSSIELLVRRRDRVHVDSVLRGLRNLPGSPDGLSPLDVHHDLFSSSSADRMPAAVGIRIEDFWERARPVQVVSVATLVFCHEDLLLHLAVSLTMGAGFVGNLRALRDIGEMCSRYGDTIDWRQLVQRAYAYDLAKQLYYPLQLARELVGADMPSAVLSELRASFTQLPLEERLIGAVTRRAILSGDPPVSPLSSDSTLATQLLAIRSARDAAMVAGRQLRRFCKERVRRLAIGTEPRPVRATGDGGSNLSLGGGQSLRSDGSPLEPSIRLPAQRSPSAQTVGEVAVTYDNHATTDGAGSQLLRIYGLYALSRALHTKYVHTPLARVDYQGFLPLLTQRTDPDFVAPYNRFFSLPSDDFDLDSCERVRIHILRRDTVDRYREHAATTGRPVLLQAIHHYGYTDGDPAAFHALRAVSPYRAHQPVGPIRVCIHLRRGDISVPGRTDGQQRLLPNRYYLRICSAVLDALRQQQVPFVVRLHTEVPARRYTLYPDTPGLYFSLDQPVTVDPSEYALEEFAALPNLEMVLNVEAREALDDFATADVLILSLSSLGYLAGLLNPHGLVIYAPWWHPALPDWLVTDEHGNLDSAQVAARIGDRLRRRALCESMARPGDTLRRSDART